MPVRGIKDAQIVISDVNLKIEETCTDLCLILNENLKWQGHIENRTMTTLKVFHMIRRNTTHGVITNQILISTSHCYFLPCLMHPNAISLCYKAIK